MEDGVKFIFKSLIKVPLIIMAAYLVLNMFAFAYIYFKMLGFSYGVMQVAIENNYIPPAEFNTLENFLDDLDNIPMAGNVRMSCDSDGRGNNVKQQYGNTVTVSVDADYVIIWPLTYDQTLATDAAGVGAPDNEKGISSGSVAGYGTIGDGSTENIEFKDNNTLDQDRASFTDPNLSYDTLVNADGTTNVKAATVLPIHFEYTVPGLKYYPDLLGD